MRFLDLIREPIVENAATYKQMMQNIAQRYQQVNPNVTTEIWQQVKFIRNTYQRQDRIVWALRWLRLQYAIKLSQDVVRMGREAIDAHMEWTNKAVDTYKAELIKGNPSLNKLSVLSEVEDFAMGNFARSIAHYMAYADQNSANYVHGIGNYVFKWQTPAQILIDLGDIEQEWKENRQREIPHAEDHYRNAEKLIDFGDGFAWWNTNEKHCDVEGSAMGHCGNNQGSYAGDGDRVLSLRQEVMRGGERLHIPYLTFILDADDRLGEMKGRANEKPKERYHKYIVPLLMSDYVAGIKGGGHDPANNFTLNDLPDDEQDEIIDKKPELGSLRDFYQKHGWTDATESRMYDAISNENFPSIHGVEGETIILQNFDDLEDVYHAYDFEPIKQLVDYKNNRDDVTPQTEFTDEEVTEVRIPEQEVMELFRYLPDSHLQAIADDLRIDGDISNRNTLTTMAEDFDRSRYADVMARGVLTVMMEKYKPKKAISDKDLIEYEKTLINIVTSMNSLYNAYMIGDNGVYQLHMRVSDFINLLGADTDSDGDDNAFYKSQLQAYDADDYVIHDEYELDTAWESLVKGGGEYDYLDEHGIVPDMSKIISIGAGEEIPEVDWDKLDYRQVAKWFSDRLTHYFESQEEDEFDQILIEMQLRAGINRR